MKAALLLGGAAAPALAFVMVLGLAPTATVTAAPPVDPGQRLFLQCQACHSLKRGEPHKVGPNLAGTIGASAATRPGYAYSAALKQAGVRWDDATLDRWLQRPAQVVPGNKMIYAGMPRPDDRRALIAHLKKTAR